MLKDTRERGFYEKHIKRLLDFVLSLMAIVVLSPVLISVALLVKFKIGSPVFFKQKRPGLNEQIFEMYKFRSMTNEKNEKGDLLPDDIRLTDFGKWLRSTSLDELPELFNILKGDMSIVGPRPLLVKYLPLYNKTQKQRHQVRPGLTGLAQVNGRNTISWEQKFDYDVNYVKNINITIDIMIILKTIQKVFDREGISSKTCETMEDFIGTGDSYGESDYYR